MLRSPMKPTALLALLFLLALPAGCTGSPTFVTPIGLGEGGGARAEGSLSVDVWDSAST